MPADTAQASPGHVPAWKRLGLKLKYVGDTAPAAAAASEVLSGKAKRKLDEVEGKDASQNKETEKEIKRRKKKEKKEKRGTKGEGDVEMQNGKEHKKVDTTTNEPEEPKEPTPKKEKKKRKKTADPEETTAAAAAAADGNAPPRTPSPSDRSSSPSLSRSPTKSLLKQNASSSGSTSPERTLSRRKSVTFTPDTKAVDGDSIKHYLTVLDPFDKNKSVEKDEPQVTVKQLVNSATTIDTTINTAPDPPPAKKQKMKKNKEATPRSKDDDRLSYLTTFYTNRAAWKFKKNNQNWIVKHALDPQVISDEHGDALVAYIGSLQSAGTRDRLVKEAGELAKGGGALKGTEERQARAKLVLKALGHGGDESEDSSSSSESDNSDSDSRSASGSGSDDSNSSSSSESSDSDSDSE